MRRGGVDRGLEKILPISGKFVDSTNLRAQLMLDTAIADEENVVIYGDQITRV